MTREKVRVNPNHLEWLVNNRSKNQALQLKLYRIIDEHRNEIDDESSLKVDIQGLVAVVFSLWRAVFLADFDGDFNTSLSADYEKFLLNLIQHNNVGYTLDRDTRHWTYVYYLRNANDRLRSIAKRDKLLPKDTKMYTSGIKFKEAWVSTHSLAEQAIDRLRDELRLKGS